jgi:hypothetical protein
MGCQSFCCRLLVRLEPDERVRPADGSTAKGFVDKTPDGRCVHFEPGTGACAGWAERPRVCRHYDCNDDPKLQVVLRDGFVSLVRLVTTPIPAGPPRRVPYRRRRPATEGPP